MGCHCFTFEYKNNLEQPSSLHPHSPTWITPQSRSELHRFGITKLYKRAYRTRHSTNRILLPLPNDLPVNPTHPHTTNLIYMIHPKTSNTTHNFVSSAAQTGVAYPTTVLLAPLARQICYSERSEAISLTGREPHNLGGKRHLPSS